MRNLSLTLFLLAAQFASAQSYLPIVHPANEWTVKHYELFLSSRRKYRFSPDTVLINGKYYFELKYDDSVMGAHSTNRFYREENGFIYTCLGMCVLNQHCTAVGGLLSTDVSGLGAGSYWGVVRSGDGKMYAFGFSF